MRHAKQQTQTNGPSLKTAFVLWVLALCGAFLVLPYVVTLENEALAAAAARTHLDVRELLVISVAQTVVLLAIAVVVGQWAARKLDLGTPLIAALLTRRPAPDKDARNAPCCLRHWHRHGASLGVARPLGFRLDTFRRGPDPQRGKWERQAECMARPSGFFLRCP